VVFATFPKNYFSKSFWVWTTYKMELEQLLAELLWSSFFYLVEAALMPE